MSHIFTPFLIRYSARWGLVDDPTGSARKLHKQVIPRSGGLGIVMAAAVAVLFLLPIDQTLSSFVAASLVIAGFGLLDDIVELNPLQKIGGQALGVAIAMAGGMLLTDLPFLGDAPDWVTQLVTFMFVLAVINGVNFSDGMDGLAAGTALMGLVLIFALAVEAGDTRAAVISLAVAAAILGFLRFNTHPAVIFMGDAGSQFLGFSLAWLAITMSQGDSGTVSTLMPVLILGIPVMDILQVVPVRVWKRLPLPGPDKEHFHHQVAKLGFHQNEVVAIIYLLQTILLCSAYVYRSAADIVLLAFYVAFMASVLGVLLFAHLKHWTFRSLEADVGSGYRRRSKLFRYLGELHPYSGTFIAAIVASHLIIFCVLSKDFTAYQVYACVGWAAALLAGFLIWRERWSLGIGRVSSFSASIILVWGVTRSMEVWPHRLYIDASLALLALLLLVAIRTTRRSYFRLTNGDLIVALAFVALGPLLLLELGHVSLVMSMVFRFFVLFYACEYLLARGERTRNQLTAVSITALAISVIHL